MDHEAAGPSRYLALESTNLELEALVYRVSHDLKSPLVALLGYLDYFTRDFGASLPDEARHSLDRMSASGAYMLALVHGLLELSQTGCAESDADAVDLGRLVADVAAEVGAGHHDVSLEVASLPLLWMNPVRARQLLTNLITNAAEHAGRPHVTVSVDAETEPDGAVVLVVADDGPGIAPEHRERVFGVFERLGDEDRPAHATGIGLAICRRITEGVGGSIWLADAPSGTRVCVRFPAETVHRPASALSASSGAR